MSRPPFVLHLICTSIGGGAHHIVQLIEQSCFRDYRVGVIIPEDGDQRVIQEMTAAGAELIRLKSGRWFSLSQIAWLAGLLRRLRPDIFHLHGLRASAPGRLAAFTLLKRPKIVYTVHGFHVLHYAAFRRRLGIILEKSLSPLTDRFICPSVSDSQALVHWGVTKSRKVTTILNGADLKPTASDVSTEFNLSGKRVITSVCRLHPQKDLDTLLDAFCRVSTDYPDSVLVLVGDGPLRAALEENVTARGLRAKVIFAGMRPDVESFLQVTDLFCLSSRWEVTSLALIEAMAARVPVIASDIDGLRELVNHGETGLLVPAGDPATLAEAMSRCMADSLLCERLSSAAHESYTKNFTASRMAAETEAVYRELLGSGRNAYSKPFLSRYLGMKGSYGRQ